MDNLVRLLNSFWIWTQLPEEKWGNADLIDLGVDAVLFPLIGEICDECINLINQQLSPEEINMFLMGLAIDSEDEDILNECKDCANDSFLYDIISEGVSHPQSEARWQLAEMLRRPIPQRDYFLKVLLSDTNLYVRKRANNVVRDLENSSAVGGFDAP